MKVIHKIIILTFIIATLLAINSVSAISFQSSELVSFTFNPTVQITISDNLTIPSLSPGDSKDSNIITVTASSNAIAGYTLSSSVGSTTNPSTELRKDGTSTTHKFDSITTNKPTLSDFNGNDWGYSYSTDSGTTWQSGDITGTPASGYNGLPLYTTETPITLINSTDASTNSVQFKIGARANTTQVAGEYTNVVNFIGVAKPNPPTFDDLFLAAGKTKYKGYYTMQDMSSDICTNASQNSITYLIDTRDDEVYMIAKLADDECWMLDNLRLDPTDSTVAASMSESNTNAPAAAISNFFTTSQTAPQTGWSKVAVADVDTGFSSYTDPMINNNSLNTTVTGYGAGSRQVGIYYNYCAATVGTYCYAANAGTGDASYDICPANWRMPTGGPAGEYQALCNSVYGGECTNPTSMTGTSPNSLQYVLSTTLSGYYDGSQASNQGAYGFFWSSTRSSGYDMYNLGAHSSSVYPQNDHYRVNGFSVRCVAGS